MKTVIDSRVGPPIIDFREIFAYRDLLWALAYRDLRVRYAQTYFGVLWVLLQPVAMVLVLTLLFDRIGKVPTGGVPYAAFALAGMAPWSYFAFLMSQAGSSLVANRSIITKVYFPRIIVPLSRAVVGLADFAVNLALLGIVMLVYGVPFEPRIAALPLFILLALLAGLTAGLWIGALSVRYRDAQAIIPFLVQFGMLASPVAYPASLVPEQLRPLYAINPMTGVIGGFRWALFGGAPPGLHEIASAALLGALFVAGLWWFHAVERSMADKL